MIVKRTTKKNIPEEYDLRNLLNNQDCLEDVSKIALEWQQFSRLKINLKLRKHKYAFANKGIFIYISYIGSYCRPSGDISPRFKYVIHTNQVNEFFKIAEDMGGAPPIKRRSRIVKSKTNSSSVDIIP